MSLTPIRCAFMGTLCALTLVALGCETPPDTAPNTTLRDIRSTVTPPDAAVRDLPPDDSTIPPDAAAQAHVTTVLLPLDQSVNQAWALADEEVFPALTRGVWHSNGLRVGLLRKSDLNAFMDELPGRRNDLRQQRIIGGPVPLALRRSRPLAANFYADLTVPPFAPKREDIRGHRLQLLIRFRPQAGDFTLVDLTPQHHKPRQMLRPRSAQEKLMEGRIFEELSITVAVPRDRYLLLGLARDPATLPPEPAVDPDAPDNGDAPDAPRGEVARHDADAPRDIVLQNDDGPAPAQPRPVPNPFPRIVQELPLNLGRALMTQAVPGGEAQAILIMDIEPLR